MGSEGVEGKDERWREVGREGEGEREEEEKGSESGREEYHVMYIHVYVCV